MAGGTSAVVAVRENPSGNGAYSPDRGARSLWHTGRRGFGGSGCSAPEKPDDRSAYKGISFGIFTGRSGTAFRDGDVRLDGADRSLRRADHDPETYFCIVRCVCLCLSANPDFVLSAVVITVVTLVRVIRGRDLWALILLPTAYLAAFSLLFIEGKATLYRSAQFLPIFCGYGVLLFVYAVWKVTAWWERKTQKSQNSRICRGVRGIAILVLAVIVWNQCMDMTKWFYIDKQKYDAAVQTVDQIALDLERDFDTSKPVIFTGNYEIPYSIVKDAYVSYGDSKYYKMKRLTDLIDPDLLDKYNRGSRGVWVAQTPALSVIDWGRYAFDSDAELVKFFAMHGHSLVACGDIDRYAEAEEESLKLPEYPQDGYIVDKGDYIIVHF